MKPTTQVKRNEIYVFTEVHEEMVLMNIESGDYSSLNETGGQVWKQLEKPASISSLYDIFLEMYEGDPVQIQKELYNFIQEMVEKGFLEKQD
ncbi:PqqD family protein [Echinicola sediminis]